MRTKLRILGRFSLGRYFAERLFPELGKRSRPDESIRKGACHLFEAPARERTIEPNLHKHQHRPWQRKPLILHLQGIVTRNVPARTPTHPSGYHHHSASGALEVESGMGRRGLRALNADQHHVLTYALLGGQRALAQLLQPREGRLHRGRTARQHGPAHAQMGSPRPPLLRVTE